MNIKQIKKHFESAVNEIAEHPQDYCFNPERDFTRKRKITAKDILQGIITMVGNSLKNEVVDMFMPSSNMPTTSAFIQQRDKLKPEAFEAVFNKFTATIAQDDSDLPVLAVDGSNITLPTNPDDELTYVCGKSPKEAYNCLHLNVLYDLNKNLYRTAIIQDGAHKDERKAFRQMVDNSDILRALVMADRGYESYNDMAHVQEKGWFFLFRAKDGNNGIKSGLVLPDEDCFDVLFSLKLTRKNTSETHRLSEQGYEYKILSPRILFDYLPQTGKKSDPLITYELNFRIVRFKLADNSYETILTNLDQNHYPPNKLKELYALRWGIETSFRKLKYTIGLLKYHSKKAVCIRQEIFARLAFYNFTESITSHVSISSKARKHTYTYKCNFSVAAHVCRLFLRGIASPPAVEFTIGQELIPIRPGRKRKRFVVGSSLQTFYYRVA